MEIDINALINGCEYHKEERIAVTFVGEKLM
jgi:hypothetical protein